MRFHFTAETDQETGELGWKDERVSRHGPYGPLSYPPGLAHDCIEHFSLDEVSDEIEAHGAIYWTRYQGGWCNKYGQNLTLEGMGVDWIGLARAVQDGHEIRTPPKTRALDSEIEEDISTIIAAGRKTIREDGFNDWQELADTITKHFRAWFRIGFRKAGRRWARKKMNPAQVSHLFNMLADAFENNMPEAEGQQLTVMVTKNGQIRFHEPAYEVSY